MLNIKFSVVGEIKTKQRPRATVVGGHARVYSSKETIYFENYIKSEFQRQCGNISLQDKPFGAIIKAYFKAPQVIAKYKGFKDCLSVGNKDIDNISKSVLDALNKIAFSDDKQCVELNASKRYASDGVERIEVFIYELPTETIQSLQRKAKIERLKARRDELLEIQNKSWLNSCESKRLEEINNELRIEELSNVSSNN